jgi:hypothetical protein
VGPESSQNKSDVERVEVETPRAVRSYTSFPSLVICLTYKLIRIIGQATFKSAQPSLFKNPTHTI